ncbi:MAG TPA: DUF503 domain-containing protein [Desulfobacteraceae bacterium]|nr:DUF503 domain-containing protein [Desulfobacteraceae bacterium]
MVVGTLRIYLYLHENRSLKGKRKVVRSIIDRVRARFNVSVAEVGSNDKWQSIELGVSTVSNDRRVVDSSLSTVRGFIESLYLAEVIDSEMEIINL